MKLHHCLILFCLLVSVSCGRVDFEKIETGETYAGLWENKRCAVVFDYAEGGDLKGRLYIDEGRIVATPTNFSANLKKNGKGVLQVNGQEKPIKVALAKRGKLQGTVEEDAFELTLQRNDDENFHPIYKEECYDVLTTTDIVYAHTNGYWSSYPDEDKNFVGIYLQRAPELGAMKEQPLCMDIYQPADSSTHLRPVVLMIHGGAFHNGDKQDETYVKWCRHYASLGYVAVSVNYRMGFLPYKNAIDCAGYRATQDVNAAIRYLLHHADTYRINPDWIFTWGTSAGGITALNVAFMKDENRPKSVLQEGKIAKLNPKFTETFNIKAVANMWGAVHDTCILANSRIPVISFHGDADGIVPYGYGQPFLKLLASSLTSEVKNQLQRFLSEQANPSEHRDGALEDHPVTISVWDPVAEKVQEWVQSFSVPVWDKIVSPMYGSACIHEYLDRHGVRNKLFTVAGASQHSLHVDEHRNIVPYFYTIQDSVAQFFYAEMVPKPVNLHQESAGSPFFRIDNTDVAEIHWQVDGGVLLEKSDNRAKVVFFRDAKRHLVRVSGRYKNGVAFNEEIPMV